MVLLSREGLCIVLIICLFCLWLGVRGGGGVWIFCSFNGLLSCKVCVDFGQMLCCFSFSSFFLRIGRGDAIYVLFWGFICSGDCVRDGVLAGCNLFE